MYDDIAFIRCLLGIEHYLDFSRLLFESFIMDLDTVFLDDDLKVAN